MIAEIKSNHPDETTKFVRSPARIVTQDGRAYTLFKEGKTDMKVPVNGTRFEEAVRLLAQTGQHARPWDEAVRRFPDLYNEHVPLTTARGY